MPQNITDVIAYTSPIVAPQDGDAETAGSVLTGIQGLANRSVYLNNILNTTGVTLIRSGSAATMQAIATGPNGQAFLINTGSTIQGIYIYQSGSALSTDNKFVYAATGF